jgi:hypothetical protein
MDDIKLSEQPIGEPVFATPPNVQTPPPPNTPLIQQSTPAPSSDPVFPAKSIASEGSGNLDYTKLGVQLLAVTVICIAFYYVRTKSAKDSATIASLKAQVENANAEVESLKASNAKPQTTNTNLF